MVTETPISARFSAISRPIKVSFLVSRFVDGKDWFQKVLASRNA